MAAFQYAQLYYIFMYFNQTNEQMEEAKLK